MVPEPPEARAEHRAFPGVARGRLSVLLYAERTIWAQGPTRLRQWPRRLRIHRKLCVIGAPLRSIVKHMQPKNVIIAMVLIASLLFGCDRGRRYPASAVFTERATLIEVTENSVKVVVSLEADSHGQSVIRATFTPTEQGLHLYGKDMPQEGVRGFGRPTRLDVAGGAIKPAGPVFSDVAPHDLDAAGVKLPSYPEGPVTLRQPIEIDSRRDLTAQIEITYMACSTGGVCKPPVERKRLELKLPKG